MQVDASTRHGRYMAGASLVIVGVVFFLDQQGILALADAWRFWPLLLVFSGVARLVGGPTPRDITAAYWRIVIGVWLIVNFTEWHGTDDGVSWPYLMIALGLGLLLRSSVDPARQDKKRGNRPRDEDNQQGH